MIRFIGKFTKNGEIVAWRVSDDGVEYNIAYKAPYHEFYFQQMVDSGYKFHNYDGDITTPDGYELKDIIESSEYLSDSEIIDLIDSMDAGLLEEKDVVQYFDRNIKVEEVEVLQPESPSITTREELISYIDTLTAATERGLHKFSSMNVNSMAAKSALFSLEEIAANTDGARTRFVRMFDNHVMSSIFDVEKLVSEYGVNFEMTDTEFMLKILKEYFAFGVPGVNAKITSIRYELSPDESYKDIKSGTSNSSILKYGLRSGTNYKVYSEDIIGMAYSDMAGDEYCDSNAFMGGSSVTSIAPTPVSDSYTIVPYGYKKQAPRVVIDMISDDGIRATFMADCNEAHLFRGTDEMLPTLQMFCYYTLDDVTIPLSKIAANGIDYIKSSTLIRAFIAEETKKSTIVPKYENSFQMMLGIGVSPYYAPMYINRYIGAGIDTYTDISDAPGFARLHYFCSDTFRDGFSSNILSKYGMDDDEFTDKPISEQLEYINEEVSNLQSSGNYLVKPEIPEGTMKLAHQEYNEWFDEYNANEIGNVNFVFSLLNGEQDIGKMAVGKKIDSSINNYKSFCAVYGALMLARENNPELSCGEFLTNEITKYISLEMLFPQRHEAALGCAKDMTLFRTDMATSASTLLYITKIFRENGNADAQSANRHYGFECVVFDKSSGSKGSLLYRTIYEQIVDDLQRKGLSHCISVAGDAAAMIIMKILASKESIIPVDGVCYVPYKTTLMTGAKYETQVKLGETYYNQIKNGSLFVKKYSSNYDYCENQFSKANMKCDHYCVNAAVNPWAVTPRDGFKIEEYNIFVNYFKTEELSTVYPASIMEKIKTTGAKVIPCLRETFSAHNLFPDMPSLLSKEQQVKYAKDGFFLERKENEDIEAYITRTTNDIRVAKAEGKAIKNTTLKSDIQYEMFKSYVYNDGVETAPTYFEEFNAPLTNRHVSNMAPRVLSSKWLEDIEVSELALTSGEHSVSISRVKFTDIPFDIKLWNNDLLTGMFDFSANVYISRGKLNYNYGNSKVISSLTDTDMSELCQLRVAIQLNSDTYVVKTINGLVKVEI